VDLLDVFINCAFVGYPYEHYMRLTKIWIHSYKKHVDNLEILDGCYNVCCHVMSSNALLLSVCDVMMMMII
jgi:hypothetical protein